MTRFKGRLVMEVASKRRRKKGTIISDVEEIGVHTLRTLKHPSSKPFEGNQRHKAVGISRSGWLLGETAHLQTNTRFATVLPLKSTPGVTCHVIGLLLRIFLKGNMRSE